MTGSNTLVERKICGRRSRVRHPHTGENVRRSLQHLRSLPHPHTSAPGIHSLTARTSETKTTFIKMAPMKLTYFNITGKFDERHRYSAAQLTERVGSSDLFVHCSSLRYAMRFREGDCDRCPFGHTWSYRLSSWSPLMNVLQCRTAERYLRYCTLCNSHISESPRWEQRDGIAFSVALAFSRVLPC